MALLQEEKLVNYCDFRTRRRKDKTTYRVRIQDCGKTTCRYSDSYVEPSPVASPTSSNTS